MHSTHDLVHTVWRPLVEQTPRRHLRFRAELARCTPQDSATADSAAGVAPAPPASLVSAGV